MSSERNSTEAIEASVVVLEGLIDAHGLDYVAEMMSRVCYEKAEHVSGTWNDPDTARYWLRSGKLFEALACKL